MFPHYVHEPKEGGIDLGLQSPLYGGFEDKTRIDQKVNIPPDTPKAFDSLVSLDSLEVRLEP
jgi:hypothetical protein